MPHSFLLPSGSESSSSSDDEDHPTPIADAYTVLDIRSGLLNPRRYCHAIQELKAVISSLYKAREATKALKTLIEADVQTAIYEYPSGDLPFADLRLLMEVVVKTFPQAKKQTLCREYKQKMLQVIRDTKKKQRQQQEKEEQEGEQDFQSYSYADLPPECLQIIFSHLQDDLYSLARAAMTCTAWRYQAASNKFWERLLTITFGSKGCKAMNGVEQYESQHGFYYKMFCQIATEPLYAEMLLPWRSDRIACHNTVRWLSPETRERVLANAGDLGLTFNKKLGVTFLSPADVVMYLITRDVRQVIEFRNLDMMFAQFHDDEDEDDEGGNA